MVNVVIPINKDVEKYRQLLDDLRGSYDINVHIGVTLDQAPMIENEYIEAENFNVCVFENKSNKEEIINALQDSLEKGVLVILRRPIQTKELNKMISLGRDVVTCKKERGKVAGFFFRLWQRILSMILSVRLYPGDTSAICFGEDIADVVRSANNLSYSTRVNRWKGLRQAVVTCQGSGEKYEIDAKQNLKYILIALSLLIVGVTVTTCVALFANITIFIGLLLFCLDGICLSVAVILMIMMAFGCATGKKNYNKAMLIRRKGE